MTTLRVAFVEWPEDLTPSHPKWGEVKTSVAAVHPDILVTNELPFGPWIAENAVFSEEAARLSIRAHESGLEELINMNIPAVISSRPVRNGERLANEAFVLENRVARPLHRKQYFPNEPGWFESRWYLGDGSGFDVADVLGIKVGVLLCTDAMFNEYARSYGRQGAALIVIPRASGREVNSWKIAGAMASLVSGAYVVSSNRMGTAKGGTQFGGCGYAYAPYARQIAETNPAHRVQVVDVDPAKVAASQKEYPCYVEAFSGRERNGSPLPKSRGERGIEEEA